MIYKKIIGKSISTYYRVEEKVIGPDTICIIELDGPRGGMFDKLVEDHAGLTYGTEDCSAEEWNRAKVELKRRTVEFLSHQF